jgi:hypothetical protein
MAKPAEKPEKTNRGRSAEAQDPARKDNPPGERGVGPREDKAPKDPKPDDFDIPPTPEPDEPDEVDEDGTVTREVTEVNPSPSGATGVPNVEVSEGRIQDIVGVDSQHRPAVPVEAPDTVSTTTELKG